MILDRNRDTIPSILLERLKCLRISFNRAKCISFHRFSLSVREHFFPLFGTIKFISFHRIGGLSPIRKKILKNSEMSRRPSYGSRSTAHDDDDNWTEKVPSPGPDSGRPSVCLPPPPVPHPRAGHALRRRRRRAAESRPLRACLWPSLSDPVRASRSDTNLIEPSNNKKKRIKTILLLVLPATNLRTVDRRNPRRRRGGGHASLSTCARRARTERIAYGQIHADGYHLSIDRIKR